MEENILRKLARSREWQVIYARSKEISGIKLFKNETDFTEVQLNFLHWLEFYNRLYTDLALDEKNISEWVIDDEIRADAYVYWKDKQKSEKKEEPFTRHTKSKEKIVFTNPKKR